MKWERLDRWSYKLVGDDVPEGVDAYCEYGFNAYSVVLKIDGETQWRRSGCYTLDRALGVVDWELVKLGLL